MSGNEIAPALGQGIGFHFLVSAFALHMSHSRVAMVAVAVGVWGWQDRHATIGGRIFEFWNGGMGTES